MMLRRLLRWSLVGSAALGGLLLLAAAGGFLWLRGSLPQTEGEIEVAGLAAPVELLRDGDGIVTIRAQSLVDAYFGVGVAHAQDRLWQMDFMRRGAAGRLSEVIGPATLPIDRMMRGLGLYRVAEANFSGLSRETRRAIEAYAAGVNSVIAGREGPLPPEYQLLRTAPEPWKPADSVAWGRLMALQLSGNWRDEMRRVRLARHLSAEQIAFLWPAYPQGAPIAAEGKLGALEPSDPVMPPARAAAVLPWEWAPKSASNSWAMAGRTTTTGKPILANDPHLALRAPGTWYLVRIETPDLTLVGVTAPGVPFVILGHNGHIAWGFTTTESDTQDLFIERLAQGDPSQYQTPDGPRPFASREERIEIRGQAPKTLTLRESRHGPVISDFIPEAAAIAGHGEVVAMAWPALRDDDRSAEALAGLNRARGWGDFLRALRHFHSPQQSVIYADRDGSIALVAPARVPLRRAGDGRSPVPGWTGEYDWTGFLPFEELPRLRDPDRGRLVAANNRLVPDGYPHLISADWGYPHRAVRIEELLDGANSHSLEHSLEMQLDTLSSGARELLPILLETEASGEAARRARALLAGWDLRMDRARPEPLIFYAWIDALNDRLLRDELAESYADFARADMRLLARVLTEGREWCDDVATPEVEDCDRQVAAALETAMAELASVYGGEPGDWRWGDAHRATFAHPVFSRLPLLETLFGFGLETDGGNTTLNRGAVGFGGGPGVFGNVHGAGFRAVYDLAELDNSRFMIATGQSGNLLSPHYGGLAERWRDGKYIKIDGKSLEKAERLLLVPARPAEG